MGRNRTLGSPFEIATIRSSQTTEAHVDMYAVDAALGSPVVLTLDPNAFNGDQVVVQDVADNAGTQPILVQASPGQTILNGFGASISISTNGGGVQLTFDQGAWIPASVVAASESFLWTQAGPGQPITTVDALAGVQSGVANAASGEVSTCLGGSSNTASGGGSSCIGGFDNQATGASAGCFACYICQATGTISACLASDTSLASGLGSACVGTASGTASGDWSACVGGTNGVAGGQNSVSIGGGQAPNTNDVGIGSAIANVGFFGVACVPQQPGGGTGTAGATYTANEQAMLQAVYSALLKYGLIT